MNTENISPKSKRLPRATRIVFFASLALNVLVISAIGGAMLRPDGGPMRRSERGPASEVGLGPLGAALSRQQRRALGAEIRARSENKKEARETLRRNFANVLDALRAEEFDPEFLRRSFTETRRHLEAQQQIGVEALIAQVSNMSHGERMEFARRIEKTLRRMPSRK